MRLLAVAVEGRGVVDSGEPVFAASDEALLRGSAAFETIRVRAGRAVFLDRHADRLARSAARLHLPPTEGAAALAQEAVSAAAVDEGVLRVYRTSAALVATVAKLPAGLEELRRRGLLLETVRLGAVPDLLAGVKVTSYALNLAAQAAAERAGVDDALFVGERETVLETTTANVWWREGDVLSTPGPSAAVLPGVTRAVVVELARDEGFRVQQGAFTLSRLLNAEEAFTTSSVREVMPVVAVGGREIGNGRPGDAARRLQDVLRVRSSA